MATINSTNTWLAKGVLKTTWANMGNDDQGSSEGLAHLPDKTIQVIGTTYGTATVTFKGSNDGGTTWTTLVDPQGNALSFTSGNPVETVLENTQLVRPETAGGTGTDITVIVISRADP